MEPVVLLCRKKARSDSQFGIGNDYIRHEAKILFFIPDLMLNMREMEHA